MDYAKIGRIAATRPSNNKRNIVDTRVLQFDADFACYEVADLEKPASMNLKNLIDRLHHERAVVGAAHINAFITMGMKSGREQLATVKEYQENRDPDKPIKVRVRELRHLLANYKESNVTPVVCHFFEADDIMCRYQNDMIKAGRYDDSIIVSGDKDLWQVQGWHADVKTGRMWEANGFGKTEYREVGNVKPKLVGEGTSWFWHQMIMGDGVDNIPGLAKISNKTLDKYFPLKSRKPRNQGAAACGEAKAYEIMKHAKDDRQAVRLVFNVYKDYYGVNAMAQFVEQAYLLWMQRNDNVWDVLDFFAECGVRATATADQIARVKSFTDLSKGRI